MPLGLPCELFGLVSDENGDPAYLHEDCLAKYALTEAVLVRGRIIRNMLESLPIEKLADKLPTLTAQDYEEQLDKWDRGKFPMLPPPKAPGTSRNGAHVDRRGRQRN